MTVSPEGRCAPCDRVGGKRRERSAARKSRQRSLRMQRPLRRRWDIKQRRKATLATEERQRIRARHANSKSRLRARYADFRQAPDAAGADAAALFFFFDFDAFVPDAAGAVAAGASAVVAVDCGADFADFDV